MLLRPRTGLQDMTVELDVRHARGRAARGGQHAAAGADTEGNVQPEQTPRLARPRHARPSWCCCSRAAPPGSAATARSSRPRSAGSSPPPATSRRSTRGSPSAAPTSRARSTTSARSARSSARRDTQLADFVDSSDAALQGFANQEASIRETFQELPSTLQATQDALASGDEFALELGPGLAAPDPVLARAGPGAARGPPVLPPDGRPDRDQIRPFTRAGARADPDHGRTRRTRSARARPPLTDCRDRR